MRNVEQNSSHDAAASESQWEDLSDIGSSAVLQLCSHRSRHHKSSHGLEK